MHILISKFIMMAMPIVIVSFILIPDLYAAEDYNSSRSNLSNVIDKNTGNAASARQEIKSAKENAKDGVAVKNYSSSRPTKTKK